MLRQSTAVTLSLGPIVSAGDGYTIATSALTISASDIKLSKNGGVFVSKVDSTVPVYDSQGYYDVTLSGVDIGTLGELEISIQKTNWLPFFKTYKVISQSSYDALVSGTNINAQVAQISAGIDIASNALVATRLATSGYTAPDNAGITNIYNRIGLPVSGSISQDIQNISTAVIAGVPQNYVATSGTLTNGTNITGSYLDTHLINNNYWTTAPSGVTLSGYGLIQTIYFNVASSRVSEISIAGRFQAGVGRFVNVEAYNFSTSAFDSISNSVTRFNNSTTDQIKPFTLLSVHQDTAGNCIIRFVSPSTTTGDRFYIDQILCKAVIAGATPSEIADAVYQKMSYTVYAGSVWIDTVYGVSGTDIGINGIPTNPVNNYADALIIASVLGVKSFELAPDSTITLTQAHINWIFNGKAFIILNGQDISDAQFHDSESIDGISTGEDATFHDCVLGNLQAGSFNAFGCALNGIITGAPASNYTFINSVSNIPGLSTPTFIFGGAGNTAIGLRNYSGGMQINNMTTGDRISLEGQGQLKINSDCTGGTIAIRGCFTITDNVVGGFTGTLSDSARFAEDQNISSVSNNVSGSVNNVIQPVVLSASQPYFTPASAGDNMNINPTTLADLLKHSDLYDGKSIDYILEAAMAMVNGDFTISGDTMTLYKRDGITPFSVITKGVNNRTRIS